MPSLWPVVVATWDFGLPAAVEAWKVIAEGGSAMDAVERGIVSCENDPSVLSVGSGGLPDASGRVTLDASIMDHDGSCGAVGCLEGFRNPIRVARRVMEKTPHVMLVGAGAQEFARAQGCEETAGLSPEAARQFKQFQIDHQQGVPSDNHDTIGLLAIDDRAKMAGGCSTSGTAWKMPGRVGDSPILGAGLYVDGNVGAATATGVGELAMKVCGSFAIVERMRSGATPDEAIAEVLHRILRKNSVAVDISFIALRADGLVSGQTLQTSAPFRFAVVRDDSAQLMEAPPLGRNA